MTEFAKLREELAGLDAKATPGKVVIDNNKLFLTNDDGDPIATLFDVRGWGYLTGHGSGALGLSTDEAVLIQAANGALVGTLWNCRTTILRALAIADVGEEVERALEGIAANADDATDLHLFRVQCRDFARAALAKLKQAAGGVI